jgi:hypothetical protein
VLTLHGVSITAENARHIVASLFADGGVSCAARDQRDRN